MDALYLKAIVLVITTKTSICDIAGLRYMDPMNFKPTPYPPGSDPCKPLYWYPRHIPDYCYATTPAPIGIPPLAIPLPIPVPVGLPLPIPLPPSPLNMLYPHMVPPLYPSAPLGPPPMPLPYGLPLAPSDPMLPVAGVPYRPPPPNIPPQGQAGMVPGLPGIVSPDGGINILPFSDAYSDMLEKHKNKMIRKRIRKVFKDYEDYPRHRRRHGRHRKVSSESE